MPGGVSGRGRDEIAGASHVRSQVGGDQDGLVRGGQITKGLVGFALEVRFQPLHNEEQLDNFLNFEINF